MDGVKSSWKKQSTGIRQGCTLSPYLFLILMTVIFSDVYENDELRRELENNRPPNYDFDDVLHADDTIILSTDTYTTEMLLQRIQDCATYYGLHLNGKMRSDKHGPDT